MNYNTRLLSRDGYMRVTLVTGPENFQTDLPAFKSMLTGFSFTQGHR